MVRAPRRSGCVAAGCALLAVVFGCGGASCLGAVGLPAGVRGAAALREVDRADVVAPGGWIDGPDGRIHTQRWGPREGRPVVLVPGTSAWAGTWVELAPSLAEAGYQVVALDLPPFGYSDRPATPTYTRPDQAARILAVLASVGDGAVLVGHSFGGGPTVEAAMVAPEGAVAHLVLVNAALGLGEPPSAAAPLTRVGLVAEPLVAATLTNPAFLPTGVAMMVVDPDVVTPERVARYARPLSVRGTTSAVADWLPELLAPSPSRAADERAYRALTVPTTLVWGADDQVTPLAQAEHLATLLPTATLVALPHVGHIPQIEAPDALAAAILDHIPPPR